MIVRLSLVLLAFLAFAAPAGAADRRVQLGSFERVRISGPIEVRLTAGRAPGATVSGDKALVERIDLVGDGNMLTIRMGSGGWQEGQWGAQRTATPAAPVVVTLTTPMLTAASVIGDGKLFASAMKGSRIDLTVAGGGAIAVTMADADQLTASVVGTGQVTVTGRAARVRLSTNGPGSIDASGLVAGELVVRLDGPGRTQAQARFTADVINTGLGTVTVAGRPKCLVKAPGGGPVACGVAR